MVERASPYRERSELRFRNTLTQPLLIFTVLLSIYAITYSGIPRVEDEQLIAARTQSLIHWQALNFPQLSGNDRIGQLAIVAAEQADFNAAVEPGPPIVAGLFYWIAHSLSAGGTQGALASNLYITALTAVVLYFLLLSMEFRHGVAGVCALLFGLGTMVWPYSKTLFRDVLLMFFALIVVLGFSISWQNVKRKRLAGWMLMALGLIGAVLTKRTGWVLIPALLVATLMNWRVLSAMPGNRRWLLGAGFLGVLVFMISTFAASSTGLLARYGAAHYAFVLQRMLAGVGKETLPAILGPFISPGKSIFLFSPILILAPFGLVQGWKAYRPVFSLGLATILILATAQALFYREARAGIPVWGLRFMLLSMPLMIVFSAPIIDRALRSRGAAIRGCVLGLFAISLVAQIAGAAVSWHIPLVQWAQTGWNPYAPGSVWNLANLPIPIHLGALFNPGNLDMAWLRLLPFDRRAAAMPITFLTLAGIAIGLWFRTTGRPEATGKHVRVALVLAALGLILPLFPGLVLYAQDPAAGGGRPTYHAMLARLRARVQPGDLVIVDSYGTPLWHCMMNHWSDPVPWYSLPYAPGRTAARSASALTELIEVRGSRADRIWLLQSADLPDPSFEELFAQDYRLEASTHFEGNPPADLQLYTSRP